MDAVVTDTMADQQNAEIERTVRKEHGRLFNFIRKTENALRLRKHYAMRSLRARLESLYNEI